MATGAAAGPNMRTDVAAGLLAEVLGTEKAAVAGLVEDFQTLATYKYDAYDGYRPGTKFLESVIGWIAQFRPDERLTAALFARRRLLFISRQELHHLVELVYPSVIRPALLRQASERTGTPWHNVATLAASKEFASLQRATLVLGLSDGALLDVLRRLSPQLRHEQFSPVFDVPGARLVEMTASLRAAQAGLGLPAEGRFSLVVLVDDFSATGSTLLRNEQGRWDGRLWKASQSIASLVAQGALSADHRVRLVFYVATDQAERRLGEQLGQLGLPWDIDVLQRIGEGARVTPEHHPELYELCRRHDDGTRVAYVPTERGPLAFGCGGAALPLVLAHNTPDNSISLLWQDRPALGGRSVLPLFARYERYP